jgi:hypothetical protein
MYASSCACLRALAPPSVHTPMQMQLHAVIVCAFPTKVSCCSAHLGCCGCAGPFPPRPPALHSWLGSHLRTHLQVHTGVHSSWSTVSGLAQTVLDAAGPTCCRLLHLHPLHKATTGHMHAAWKCTRQSFCLHLVERGCTVTSCCPSKHCASPWGCCRIITSSTKHHIPIASAGPCYT